MFRREVVKFSKELSSAGLGMDFFGDSSRKGGSN
jgi:hypothetical protein